MAADDYDDDGPGYELPGVVKRFQRARHPPPPKTAVAAVVLLSLGATLLALAVFEDRVVARQKSQRTILIVLGLVTGLPGAYASATL